MKKIAIIAALIAASSVAMAADFGVRGGRNFGSETNSAGFTIGQKNATGFGVEGAFDRSTTGFGNTNRFSAVGTYDLAKFSNGVSLTAKAGGAFIDPSVGRNGYAGLVGVGATLPVTQRTSLTVDYFYQHGQERVRAFNGSTVLVGAKYSF